MKDKKIIIEKVALFFATGFYSGYSPFASGTAGAFVALLIYWFIPGFERIEILTIAIIIATLIGFWSGFIAEKKWGHDPGEMVLDEFVGMWITLIFVPKTIIFALIAFFFCRLFDIIKPYPANISEKLPGGFGIMIDDIIAGIYSLITVHLILYLFPWLRYV